METELHIALQLCNPQAMHDKNDGPFVRYDSHLNGDRKSLALGVNISGNKENIKSGGWAFVHALVKPGTQGADVDLDVVSLRKISKSDGPGIAITEGTSDYKCVGGEGKWILMRVGADKKSSWTVALPMHNFPEEVFESIEKEEPIRVTGVLTGRFCIHGADGKRTSAVLICPRILTFPGRPHARAIRPLPLESDALSQSYDLYDDDDWVGEDTAKVEEDEARPETKPEPTGNTPSSTPNPCHTSARVSEVVAPSSAHSTLDALVEEEIKNPPRRHGRSRRVTGAVETDVETDVESVDGRLDDVGPVSRRLAKVETSLDVEQDDGGMSAIGDLGVDDDVDGSEEYGGEEDRQGGVDSEDDGGSDVGGSNGVVNGLDAEDEEEVESYMRVEGELVDEEHAEGGDSEVEEEAEDDAEEDGVQAGEYDEGEEDCDEGEEDCDEGEEDCDEGEDDSFDGAETETNSAQGSDDTDCSNLLAEDQEEEEDPEADYEESEVEDSAGVAESDGGQESGEGVSDGGGSSDESIEGGDEISSPIRPTKRRLQIHTDDEDEEATSPARKRRSP